MKKIYYVDVGFLKDTVIYELKPVEVKRLKQATLMDTRVELEHLGAKTLIVDSGLPEVADELQRNYEVWRHRL